MNPGKRDKFFEVYRPPMERKDFEFQGDEDSFIFDGWGHLRFLRPTERESSSTMETQSHYVLETDWSFTNLMRDDYVMIDGNRHDVLLSVQIENDLHIYVSDRHA